MALWEYMLIRAQLSTFYGTYLLNVYLRKIKKTIDKRQI